MKNVPQPKFKNIVRLPHGSYQLQVRINGVIESPVCQTLAGAIKLRNEYYKDLSSRPVLMYVRDFDMRCVRDDIGVERSGSPYHRYRVTARALSDRRILVRGFAHHSKAVGFAKKWVPSHNSIAAVYNKWREENFVRQAREEENMLTPLIETKFDPELWAEAAKVVFGDDVPKFYRGE